MSDEERLMSIENTDTKHAIVDRLSEVSFVPMTMDIMTRKDSLVELPLGMIALLGVGFSSISEIFQEVTQAEMLGGEALFRTVLPNGATLKQARNGLISTSARYADSTPAWGKFELVDTAKQLTPNQLYNPTVLAMAAALAQINQKLDGVQKCNGWLLNLLKCFDSVLVESSTPTTPHLPSAQQFPAARR